MENKAMPTLILIMFFNILSHLFSQNKNDSLDFFSYYENAYQLRNTNADSAFYWIEKATHIAVSKGNKEWMAKTHNLKGILFYKKNNYYESIIEFQNALKLTNNKNLVGKIYINLANTLSDLNYSHSAKQYYQHAVRVFNETNDHQFLIRALMNLSTEEFNLKEVTHAKNHLKLALYYANENNFIEEEAVCLNNLAAMFIELGQTDSASRYIYQSFNAYEQIENYYGLADAYLTAIALHLEKKELNYAKSLIDMADSLIEHIKYLDGKKILTSDKVNYYLLSNDINNAMEFFNAYLKIEDSLNYIKTSKNNTDLSIPFTLNNVVTENKKTKNNFSFIQLLIIILLSVPIIIYLFKNYRYDKE